MMMPTCQPRLGLFRASLIPLARGRRSIARAGSSSRVTREDLESEGWRKKGAELKEAPVALPPGRSNQPASNEEPQPSGRTDLMTQAAVNFLREELPRMFTTGKVTRSKYSPDIVFEDPISRYTNLDGYCFNIALLVGVFDTKFDLLDIKAVGPGSVEARWSLEMRFKLLPVLPWKPTAIFSGIARYMVDPVTGLITSHKDLWDSVSNNDFLSLEGLRYVLSSLAEVRLTPELETPDYKVLYKTSDYEIRRYEPYTVAEVGVPQGSGPASGNGFMDLAGYIFGGNESKVNMEMTTPVYSTAGQQGVPNANKMQFVMERRFAQEDKLPAPNSNKITAKVEEASIRAAASFGGFPLDFEVFQAEKQLREALVRDRLLPAGDNRGYLLARYNEPTVPPFLKRNEVLIELPDYKLPPLQ